MERWARELATRLPALRPGAYAVLRPPPRLAHRAGHAWEQLVLPGLIRQSRANVLFAPAYTAPLTSPVPVVLTVHDVSFVAHPEWFSWREGVRRRVMTKASARRAARVLTQSDFTKREAVRYLGLDQSRVDVI